MRVITPQSAITDATLYASSIAEDEHPAWAAPTVYATGQRVVSAHRVFERLTPGASATVPTDDTDNWQRIGWTRRWAMFDPAMASPSTAAGSITAEILAGAVTDVVLLGVVGSQVQVSANGATVRTVSVPAPAAPFTSSTVHISGLSIAAGQRTGITVTGSGTVQVAHFLAGSDISLGTTLDDPSVGITDRSTVETDDFGVTRVVPRPYNRWIQASVYLAGTDVDRVAPILEGLRAVPAYWIALDGVEALACLGVYRDWSIDVQTEDSATYSIRLDGMARNDAAIAPGGFVSADAAGTAIVDAAAYIASIESTNGTVFQVGGSRHTLMVGHVFRNGEEVTQSIPDSWFRWRRVSEAQMAPPNDDATWNAAYATGYKQIDIAVDAVNASASFFLDIIKP